MSNYIIYKIYCDDCDDVYIGSTRAFSKRKWKHKNACNNSNNKHYNMKVYQTIREHGGWDNWRMIPIEELGDVSKIQSFIKEEEWRVKLDAKLNSKKAYSTEEDKKEYIKEYREQHKEDKKEYDKEYREQNKEQLKEYREQNKAKKKEYDKEHWKEYYQQNKAQIKEKLKEYREQHKEQIKEYKEKNKAQIKEYNKEYREKNKEQIKAKYSEKITCQCGAVICRNSLSRHIKTQTHQNNIKII